MRNVVTDKDIESTQQNLLLQCNKLSKSVLKCVVLVVTLRIRPQHFAAVTKGNSHGSFPKAQICILLAGSHGQPIKHS